MSDPVTGIGVVATPLSIRKDDRRKLMGGAIGNIGEQFDYSIYALTAPTLALHFFPQANPVAAILSTFAVYALAFAVRPLGGVLFGYIADKSGRLRVLQLTIVCMGIGTVIVGVLPTFEAIGIAAPLLLIAARLLQGLSLGGETTGVQSFITESAPAGKRAYWTSSVMTFAYLGTALAAIVIFCVRSLVTESAFDAWAWRIPFLMGGLVAVVGYFLRRRLDDPEEYTEAAADYRRENGTQGKESIAKALGSFKAGKSMLLVILLIAPHAIGAYLLQGYMFTYLTQQGHLSPTEALMSNAGSVIFAAVTLPIAGRVCDRVGRKAMYILGAAWLLVTVYPAFLLAGSGSLLGALGGQLLIAGGITIYGGAMYVGLIELFPTVVRARGHGISYNAAVAIFGGATPFIATALVGASGNVLAPALYAIAVIATIGMLGVFLVPETRDVSLRSSIQRSKAE